MGVESTLAIISVKRKSYSLSMMVVPVTGCIVDISGTTVTPVLQAASSNNAQVAVDVLFLQLK
jgi:hypothetical protein